MNPVPELTERANEHVRVTGFVEDMGVEISCSSLYVSPMISGSGFKNKIVEAVIHGTYIVGTRLSFEFLPPEIRSLLTIVEGAEEMASAVNTFLDDPSQFDERLKRIQSVVIAQFSWRNRNLDLLHLLEDAYTSHSGVQRLPQRAKVETTVVIRG
jgi:glycosyltransferase involved in cell wall biosynthesis